MRRQQILKLILLLVGKFKWIYGLNLRYVQFKNYTTWLNC